MYLNKTHKTLKIYRIPHLKKMLSKLFFFVSQSFLLCSMNVGENVVSKIIYRLESDKEYFHYAMHIVSFSLCNIVFIFFSFKMNNSLVSENSPCKDCKNFNPVDDFENIDLDGDFPSCSMYDDE